MMKGTLLFIWYLIGWQKVNVVDEYKFHDKRTFIHGFVSRNHTGCERLDQVYNEQCFPVATKFSSTSTITTSLNVEGSISRMSSGDNNYFQPHGGPSNWSATPTQRRRSYVRTSPNDTSQDDHDRPYYALPAQDVVVAYIRDVRTLQPVETTIRPVLMILQNCADKSRRSKLLSVAHSTQTRIGCGL